jgi:hypothetical protein
MAEKSAASDRRLALRRDMEIPVWVEALPRRAGHPTLVRALTRDISHKGAFIWVAPVFALGQKLHLEMDVAPDPLESLELKLDCSAEVVRLEPPSQHGGKSGIGVRILRFDAPVPVYAPPD